MRISPPIAVCSLIAVALGVIGAGRWYGGDCGFDPSGQSHWLEGVKGTLSGKDCDPWRFVQPDASITSITIDPYSNWTRTPARTVTIRADGTLNVEEPLDLDSSRFRLVASAADSHLAKRLLTSLSRYTRYNRLTNEDLETFAKRLPTEADKADVRNYMIGLKLNCLGRMYDRGGVEVRFTEANGTKWRTMMDSYCWSPAMESAIDSLWNAHKAAFARTGFRGEPYVKELAGPGL